MQLTITLILYEKTIKQKTKLKKRSSTQVKIKKVEFIKKQVK
jgi:hypothetical protein